MEETGKEKVPLNWTPGVVFIDAGEWLSERRLSAAMLSDRRLLAGNASDSGCL